VWRRLEPTNFREAHGLMANSMEQGMWLVCDEGYEISGDEIVAALEYSDLSDEWSAYTPLEEVPDLFLKFGKLYEQADFEQAALAFSNNYGLPGGRQEIVHGDRGLKPTPTRMKVSQFRDEARRAWGVLALYESVLNGDAPAVKDVFLELRDDKVFSLWEKFFRFEQVEDSDQISLSIGLMGAAQTVEEAVHELCRHRIRFSLESDKGPDLSTVHTDWDFDNLLGTTYLQMWWLMASAGDITRCEFCGRIVSLARSHPEGRKRRRDTSSSSQDSKRKTSTWPPALPPSSVICLQDCDEPRQVGS
jgi:hypothetical protein